MSVNEATERAIDAFGAAKFWRGIDDQDPQFIEQVAAARAALVRAIEAECEAARKEICTHAWTWQPDEHWHRCTKCGVIKP